MADYGGDPGVSEEFRKGGWSRSIRPGLWPSGRRFWQHGKSTSCVAGRLREIFAPAGFADGEGMVKPGQ